MVDDRASAVAAADRYGIELVEKVLHQRVDEKAIARFQRREYEYRPSVVFRGHGLGVASDVGQRDLQQRAFVSPQVQTVQRFHGSSDGDGRARRVRSTTPATAYASVVRDERLSGVPSSNPRRERCGGGGGGGRRADPKQR